VGYAGTGTTYAYDSHGRIIESSERNFAFEKTTTILYNAQGDRAEERRAIRDNSVIPVGGEYSIDKNGSSVPGQPEVERLVPAGVVPSEDSTILYSYQYDSHGINHSSLPDEPLSVSRRKLTYY